MASEGALSIVRLMRAGERESNDDPESGLRKEGKGEGLIREVTDELPKESGFSRLSFNKVLIAAPSRIADETANALIRHSNVGVTHAPFVTTPAIHFQDHTSQQWSAVVANFAQIVNARNKGKKSDEINLAGTLADLEKAAKLCQERGIIEEEFLTKEAERILAYITGEVKGLPPESALLCIMHSPLPETVMLRLWHKAGERFQREKPLDKIPALDHIEIYDLGFVNGLFTRSIGQHFVKMLEKQKKERMELMNSLRPEIRR